MTETSDPSQPPARAPRKTLRLAHKPAAPVQQVQPAIVVVPSAPRIFPLGRLRRADENVRHTRIDEGCDALADDIQAHGLLQQLIGYEDGGYVEIVGGGRRLKALRIVRDRGHIDDDFQVPVLIRGIEEAIELSLAENLQQRNMSPVDEFFAFAKLMERGDSSPADLARRFGFSEKVVRQRLRLAQLARPVLDALAEREITIDAALAYASSQDQALQEQVFSLNAKRGGRRAHDPDRIRTALRMRGLDTADRIIRFVGADRYEAEGGGYEDDLFAEPGKERVLAQPFLAETIADRMIDMQATRMVGDLCRDDRWSPTIAGFVKVPDLRLHHYGTERKLVPPVGFALVQRASPDALWAVIRAQEVKVHVLVGLDVAGALIADRRYAFVPVGQKAAIEKPALVEQAKAQATAEIQERERDIILWSRRLAVGSFMGSPVADRAVWPTAPDLGQHRPWEMHGEAGFLVPVYVFASDGEIAAARKDAVKRVEERRHDA